MFFYNEPVEQGDSETLPIATSDPYFYNTSLLLKMDSDFSDSGIYNHSVTANGNSTIISTESKYGGGSGYFDGSGDYLQLPYDSSLDLSGNPDWTFETWIYMPNSVPAAVTDIIGASNGPGGVPKWGLKLNQNTSYTYSPNRLGFFIYDGGPNWINVSYTWQPNTWYHIAVANNSGTTTMYVDGTSVGTLQKSIPSITGGLRIGSDGESVGFFNGYLDDLRITKGVARYTADFTPPDSHPTTGPSEIVSTGMVLELDAEDYETVGYNGGTKTSGGNDPIYVGTGEKYFQFNGAGHISWPSNSAYAFGTGAFTVEFWTQGYLNRIIQPDNTIDGSDNSIWWAGLSPTYGAMLNRHAAASTGIRSDAAVDYNNWVHTIIVREAGNNRIYANGQLQTITLSNIDGVSFGQSGMIIGAGSVNTFATGKIAAVRVFNRSLTEAEALQNFNATKSRFGL